MSKVRNPTFTMTNASTRNQGCSHHELLFSAMASPKFVGHRLQLYLLFQHGIVSVPLHEVGAAHEGSVFGGAAIVVPQIEIQEVDRLREWRTVQQAFVTQAIDQILGVG